MNLKETVKECPILAIMRNVPVSDICDYTGAVLGGGISFFEVALNSRDALQEISMLRDKYQQQAYIGAGTVLSIEDAKAAVNAGAEFLLSPAADERVLEYCASQEIAIMPGAVTPSEAALCLRYGFDVIKLFPAAFMLPGYVKSLKGPLDKADFVAIGGVSWSNRQQFIEEGYMGVGLASDLIPKEYLVNKNWEGAAKAIESLVRG